MEEKFINNLENLRNQFNILESSISDNSGVIFKAVQDLHHLKKEEAAKVIDLKDCDLKCPCNFKYSLERVFENKLSDEHLHHILVVCHCMMEIANENELLKLQRQRMIR